MTNTTAETTQPAAAQEAVAWRDDAGNLYPDKESVDKYLPRGRTVHALYAAPVAAVPAMESMGKRKLVLLQGDGFIVNGVAIFNPETGRRGLVDYLGYVGWVGSTPAAPGIDLDALRDITNDLSHSAKVDDYETQQIAFIESIRDRLLALIDASPKGGSDAEVMQLRYQLNSLRQLLSGFEVEVQNNPLQPPCTYLEEVRLSHEFQPGEGQKVAAALRNALNSNSEGAKS